MPVIFFGNIPRARKKTQDPGIWPWDVRHPGLNFDFLEALGATLGSFAQILAPHEMVKQKRCVVLHEKATWYHLIKWSFVIRQNHVRWGCYGSKMILFQMETTKDKASKESHEQWLRHWWRSTGTQMIPHRSNANLGGAKPPGTRGLSNHEIQKPNTIFWADETPFTSYLAVSHGILMAFDPLPYQKQQ